MDDEAFAELLAGEQPGGGAPDSATRALAALRSPGVWAQPTADGADELVARIAHEQQDAAPPRATITRRRLLVGVAAAAILGVGGVGGWLIGHEGNADRRGVEVALAPTGLAPGASGVALVRETPSGVAISLDVDGLPPAAPGTYYEAWLRSRDGTLVAIGTFHLRGGTDTIELWAGVDPATYPTLTVTIQSETGGPRSSGKVVLKGTIG